MTLPAYDAGWLPDFRGQGYGRRRIMVTSKTEEDSPADEGASFTGTNWVYGYALSWRRLTADQAALIELANQMQAGGWGSFYFLEWQFTVEQNMELGIGDGLGDLEYQLPCRLKEDDATAAGLVVTRDFDPIPVTVSADSGNNYVQHKVTIDGGENVLGGMYRASWTEARRRRKVKFVSTPRLAPNGVRAALWSGNAELIETERT